jgi:lipid-A-disaccharide synthase
VIFYCPPQIWAWASWRIGKMRRLVDHVLAALPFEQEWFVAQGMRSTLVGHPFFDELPPVRRGLGSAAAPGPLVLLLPGSRGQEIEANLSSMLQTARRVTAEVPQARFAIAALHERHARRIRDLLPAAGGVPIDLVVGRTRSLIADATAAIAVSGSVSLELLAARVPTVIVYRISGLAYVVQSWFRHARFITLVNLLACRNPVGPTRPVLLPPRTVPPADPEAVYPEYLAVQDPAAAAASHLITWLRDDAARQAVVARLEAIAAEVGQGGSAARAAAHVLAVAAGGRDHRAVGLSRSPTAGRHAA